MKYNGHDIADNEFHSEVAATLRVSDGCSMDIELIQNLLARGNWYIESHTDAGNKYSNKLSFICTVNSRCVDGNDEGDMVEIVLIADRYETELEKTTRINREKEYWDKVDAKKPDYEAMRKADREKVAGLRKNDDAFCRYEYEREIMKRNGCLCIPSFDKWKKYNGIE